MILPTFSRSSINMIKQYPVSNNNESSLSPKNNFSKMIHIVGIHLANF